MLDNLKIFQLLRDLHAVEPLLLLIDPGFTGVGLVEHLVECQSILQCLLPQLCQLHHLLVALFDSSQPDLNLQTHQTVFCYLFFIYKHLATV